MLSRRHPDGLGFIFLPTNGCEWLSFGVESPSGSLLLAHPTGIRTARSLWDAHKYPFIPVKNRKLTFGADQSCPAAFRSAAKVASDIRSVRGLSGVCKTVQLDLWWFWRLICSSLSTPSCSV